jgi:hypothetical protein
MSIIGTVPPPTDARYSPDDAPDPSAPSVPQTSPFMGNFTDAQQPYGYAVTGAKRMLGLIRRG